ncbi:cyclin-like protein [Piedraia hortae CBS 480.64]|uniref:RNA polymerase II holoenzyme cyclin-like subunit n=1 Tax=Piedraia hortae CBS 480.64 TaxID=1314780 RepID=A0A6A7C2A0_9PEZI|nr:cyclin-like protein [Piedraia hortae CBS 480.64]
MAGNYWTSTQLSHWTFTRPQLATIRQNHIIAHKALFARYPLPCTIHINIYIQTLLSRLARRLNIRQQTLSTAQVYLTRYFLKTPLQTTNPYLLLTTALYLSSKTEESPQHIRIVSSEASRLFPDMLGSTPDTNRIGECEFVIIATLSSQLVVHHPYNDLLIFANEVRISPHEKAVAMAVVNDSLNTDLGLIHAPHTIALAALVLAVTLKGASLPLGQARPGAGAVSATPAQQATQTTPLGRGFGTPMSAATGMGTVAGTVAAGATAPQPGSLAAQLSQAQIRPAVQVTPAMTATAANSAMRTLGAARGAGGTGSAARLITWLAASEVDIGSVADAVQELVTLYQVWETYSEKACRDAFARLVLGTV